MLDIRIHDETILRRITYQRFIAYVGNRGWSKLRDETYRDREVWARADNKETSFLYIYPTTQCIETMEHNLMVIATCLKCSQLSVVAELLGDIRVASSFEDEGAMYWKELRLDDGHAEIAAIVYNAKKDIPYVDGDKTIVASDIYMDEFI